MDKPRLLTDLYEFVSLHRPHGELQADADAPNGKPLAAGAAGPL